MNEIRDGAVEACMTAFLAALRAQEQAKMAEEEFRTVMRTYNLSDAEWRLFEARKNQALLAVGR